MRGNGLTRLVIATFAVMTLASCGGGDTEKAIIRDRNVANSGQIDAPTTAVFCQKYQAMVTWVATNNQGDAAWGNQVASQLYAMLPDAPSANVEDVNDMLALYNAVARSAPTAEQTALVDDARSATDRLNTLCNVAP